MYHDATQLSERHTGSSEPVYPLRPATWPALARHLSAQRLTWWPDPGVGFYPVAANPANVYDQTYFDSFARNANTDLGRALMQARCELVAKYWTGELLDVGIGSGAFLDTWRDFALTLSYGFDINPAGYRWLHQRDLYRSPYIEKIDAVTLWDVLEHIENFTPLLANVRKWVFLAIPIFTSSEHVLRSKHFKPDEHFWYFTCGGLEHVMRLHGFELVASNMRESQLGREDILSAVFRRR
jgi:Methyltransferase domain